MKMLASDQKWEAAEAKGRGFTIFLFLFLMQETPTNELSSQGAPGGDAIPPGSMAEPGLEVFPPADGFSEYCGTWNGLGMANGV